MQAFHRTAVVRSSPLWNSYVEISSIIRTRYHLGTRPAPPTRPTHLHTRSISATTSQHRPRREESVGQSITEGFPTPPDAGFAPDIPREPGVVERHESNQQNHPDHAGTGRHGDGDQKTETDVDPRHHTSRALIRLATQSSAMAGAQTWTWDRLQAFQDAPEAQAADATPIPVELFGFVTSHRPGKNGPDFFQLVDPHMRRSVQLKWSKDHGSTAEGPRSPSPTPGLLEPVKDGVEEMDGTEPLPVRRSGSSRRGIHLLPHTPVLVTGYVHRRQQPLVRRQAVNTGPTARKPVQAAFDPYVGDVELIGHLEIDLTSVRRLNQAPKMVPKHDTVFPPEQRVWQFRTSSELRKNIRLRSRVMALCRKFLFLKGFDEIETPVLFKSTPEGAREFVVPTRHAGMAYALPQSPQQYKQMLMASGFSRYFQFAKCFRDEDRRADRQPEFTQLDLEMSFARREDVMVVIERLIASMVWPAIRHFSPFASRMKSDPDMASKDWTTSVRPVFPQYTYDEVMTLYGSDKPDTRLGSRISRVEDQLPADLKKMLTSIEDPAVDLLKIDMKGATPATSGQFITDLLDHPESAPYRDNPAGPPGIMVVDPKKPLNGLASFGHASAEYVESLMQPEAGDILVLQARTKAPFTGGSTPLGNLRRDIIYAAIAQGLRKVPDRDEFLWVTDFPLFSPLDGVEPGQRGSAGLCSTHHPFTAPKTERDIFRLLEDPLSVIGDHYDLVINGVEVGGGSVRLHDAHVQEIVLRDVLKMPPERIADFDHLLGALRAGCPPHAGFALGFDRLMAILLRQNSVRDVIAFPKTGDGEDKMVGAPSRLSQEQLDTYHLQVKASGGTEMSPPISRTAEAGVS